MADEQRKKYYSPSKDRSKFFSKRQVESNWFKKTDWELEEIETPKSLQAKEEVNDDLADVAQVSPGMDDEGTAQEPVTEEVIEEEEEVEEEEVEEEVEEEEESEGTAVDQMDLEEKTDDELIAIYTSLLGKAPHHKKKRENIIKDIKNA